jgi:hypothetical protein
MTNQNAYISLSESAAFEAYATQVLEAFNQVPQLRDKEELAELVYRLHAEEALARAAGIGAGEERYFAHSSSRDDSATGARLHAAMDTLRTFLQCILEGDDEDENLATNNLLTDLGRAWTLSLLCKESPWIEVAHNRSLSKAQISPKGETLPAENDTWTEFWFDATGEYGSTQYGHILVDTAGWPESAWEALAIERDFDRLLIAKELSKIAIPTDEDVASILEGFGLA